LRAPAVGYRIHAGEKTMFYAGDVMRIYRKKEALRGVDLYIGDGAHFTRSIMRKHGNYKMGHASIAQQVAWCADAGITKALFTHCGSQLVRMSWQEIERTSAQLSAVYGVDVRIAYDGFSCKV
jgi:phosphoribosyl 1,2-cyclic phosphodiesterase